MNGTLPCYTVAYDYNKVSCYSAGIDEPMQVLWHRVPFNWPGEYCPVCDINDINQVRGLH